MTINQLIGELEKLRLKHGGVTAVYANGEPDLDESEVTGVRFRVAEMEENLETGEDQVLWPDRVFLKS